MELFETFIEVLQPLADGDTVDKLNYFHSTVVIASLSLFISGWSFVGTPISCWFPAYYEDFWVEYALDYCYVQNTYFLPFKPPEIDQKRYFSLMKDHKMDPGLPIPQNITEREDKLIGYYQWVPFFLALQAIFFYIPIIVWRGLYDASGVNVKSICDTCADTENMSPDLRKKNVANIAKFLDSSIFVMEGLRGGKRSFMVGRYISTLYLLVKALFALNCVVQFVALKQFLGMHHYHWGATVLLDLWRGNDWMATGHFPRVTLCDYQVKVMGNLHRHTSQCVLMINMFNEKLFILLWWWILAVGLLSLGSLIYWTFTIVSGNTGEQIIKDYLRHIDKDVVKGPRRRLLVRRFIDECLKPDGVFLLRLIGSNAGDVVCSELVATMWRDFKRHHDDPPGDKPPVTVAGRLAAPDVPPPPYVDAGV